MYAKTWKWLNPVMIALDAILINAAFYLAYLVRYELQWFRGVEEAFFVPFSNYIPSAAILTGILILVYLIEGLYTPRRGRPWFDEVYTIFRGAVTGIATMIIVSLFARPTLQSRLIFAYHAILIVVLLSGSRLLIGAIMSALRRRGVGVDRVLIVGAGEVGRTVMRNIVARPELGYQLIGFVDDAPEKAHTDLGRIKALGDTSALPELISRYGINEVIITLPWMAHRKVLSLITQCERYKVRARIVPDLFQLSLSQVDIDDMNGLPLIGIREPSIRGWKLAVKRGIDLVVAVLLLISLAPLFGLIALLIKLDSPGPIIFQQVRVGRNGKEFKCYKFRTMVADAEQRQPALEQTNPSSSPWFKLRDDPRRTRVGRFLRRASLDELPQLYNVLRGEMSLIGPRPGTPQEVAKYQPWHMRRLSASPGMTGLWQVSGRSELTFDEMVLLDLYYVENWSLLLDFKILLRTGPAVFSGRGAF